MSDGSVPSSAPPRGRGRGKEPPPELVTNGLDGRTGRYLLAECELPEILALIARDGRNPHDPAPPNTRRLVAGRDPERLDQAGWGVVFGRSVSGEIREALAPLLEWRRQQATAGGEELFHQVTSAATPEKPETKKSLLTRFDAGAGPVDPRRVPYYLLLVGDPTELGFPLQYHLGIQHAVGRLWLDSPEDYRRYAETVVAAEKREIEAARQVAVFAPSNPHDQATKLSSAELASPMATWLRVRTDWDVAESVGSDASKPRLESLLDDAMDRPALVFTASHGLGFAKGDVLQSTCQGALVCQEWPGPEHPVAPEHYLAAADLDHLGGCLGTVGFHFACYGAGTPAFDDFKPRHELATEPFVSPLPRKMLGRGGALAVIGHVDRAWSCSFYWRSIGRQLTVFEDCFYRLLNGSPVGRALSGFWERAAELGLDLLSDLESIDFGRKESAVVGDWTAYRDARNTVLLGDPAVRLAVPRGEDEAEPQDTESRASLRHS